MMVSLERSISDLLKKRFEDIKKEIFSSEKMNNSGNCIYDYAHSFFVEDLQSNALYWVKIGFWPTRCKDLRTKIDRYHICFIYIHMHNCVHI